MNYLELHKRRNKKIDFSIFYTVLVVFYPLLSMYRLFDTSLSIADGLTMLFLALIFIFDFEKLEFNKLFSCIAIYVLLHTVMLLIVNINIYLDIRDLFGSTLRLLLIYFLLSFKNNYLNQSIGKKLFLIVAFIATIYLCIQYLLSFIGVYLGGGIPFHFLQPFRPDVRGYINDVIKYNLAYRPRSIFEEPAHYCQYIIVAIVLCVFDKKCSIKNRIPLIILLIFGIILSMSLLGYTALLFVFGCYLIQIIKQKRFVRLFFIFLIFIVAMLIIWNIRPVQSVIINKFKNQDISSDGRFSGLRILKNLSNGNLFVFFFGSGILDSAIYYNGVIGILVYFGLIGLIIAIGIFLYAITKFKRDTVSVVLLFTLLVLSFASEIIFGKFIIIYLIFLQRKQEDK